MQTLVVPKKPREVLAQILQRTTGDVRKALLIRFFRKPEHISLFGKFFFPHHISDEIPWFHEDIYKVLLRKGDDAIAAPREHGKSTVTGLVFITWCIVNKTDKYIVYVSQNHAKTVQFVEPIAYEFKNNERLRWVYGDLSPQTGRDDQGRDRQDCIDIGGCRVEAVSFEKNLRGFKYNNTRPTLIILDDIEEDQRVLNPALRVKDTNKLNKVIIPSLDVKTGRIKMIGTILNAECLLLQKIHQYRGKVYKAILPDGSPLWPGRWTLERLEERKKSIGSVAFASEYLNEPLDSEASIIKAEWVRACFDQSLSYDDGGDYDHKYLGVDFAFSDRVTADKSAYVGLGSKGDVYTLVGLDTRKGLTITQQFELLQTIVAERRYDDVALEENSIRSMSAELYKYTFPYTLYWTSANDAAEQIKPSPDFQNRRHTVGKKAMLLRLATLFENKAFRIPYKTTKDREKSEELLAECVSFALNEGKVVEIGVHPDIPIALALACERAKKDNFEWIV